MELDMQILLFLLCNAAKRSFWLQQASEKSRERSVTEGHQGFGLYRCEEKQEWALHFKIFFLHCLLKVVIMAPFFCHKILYKGASLVWEGHC